MWLGRIRFWVPFLTTITLRKTYGEKGNLYYFLKEIYTISGLLPTKWQIFWDPNNLIILFKSQLDHEIYQKGFWKTQLNYVSEKCYEWQIYFFQIQYYCIITIIIL